MNLPSNKSTKVLRTGDFPLHRRTAALLQESPTDKIAKRTEYSSIKKIPTEVRLMIFSEYLNAHPADGTVPSLLTALNTEGKIHEEAASDYNIHVNSINEETFKKQHINGILSIRNIILEYPLAFKAQKIVLKNNLQTITIDITEFPPGFRTWTGSHAKYLMQASKQVRKLTLKFNTDKKGKCLYPYEGYALDISSCLGMRPKLEATPKGTVWHWIWEAEEGKVLALKPYLERFNF